MLGFARSVLSDLTALPAPLLGRIRPEGFGADPNRWMFLTGTATQIAKLATDSLKLAATEKKPEEREAAQDLFIHSTYFVIVDKRARLRGVFETTGDEIDPQKDKAQILAAARQLEEEP